jgi:two-component system, NarL family, invasion response regulator UvrY
MHLKRALLVDDHVIARMGLKVLLKEMFPGAELEEAQNGDEAEEKVKQFDFDLCLLDLNMPKTDSITLLKRMLYLRPTLKVLVISMNNEEVFAVNVLKSGALGYISKENSFDVIRDAIIRVLENKKYMSDKVLNMLLDYEGRVHNFANPFSKLSERELMVAKLMIEGYSTKQIADKANLQLSTISTYKGKIFNKLQITNAIELFELSRLHKLAGINTFVEDEIEFDKSE